MIDFETVLRLRQPELKKVLQEELLEMGYTPISRKGYLYAPGEIPVLLVAHLDTVHYEPPSIICYSKDGRYMMSPQGIGGDDRCGIYALNAVYARAEVKPWLLFTCDEEIGGYGAKDFAKDYHMADLPKELDFLKCIVEIDRKGRQDLYFG